MSIQVCAVTGRFLGASGEALDVRVTVQNKAAFAHSGDIIPPFDKSVESVDGVFSVAVIETETVGKTFDFLVEYSTANQAYQRRFKQVEIPNAAAAAFADIVEL